MYTNTKFFGTIWFQQGKAALHLAAENGHNEVAEILLQNRAYVGSKSKQGVTPLHFAAQNGFVKLVRILVDVHGAAIDAMTLVNILLQSWLWKLAVTNKVFATWIIN